MPRDTLPILGGGGGGGGGGGSEIIAILQMIHSNQYFRGIF